MTDKIKVLILGVLALSFLSFSIIIYTTTKGKHVVVNQQSVAGKKIWQEKNCQACHQFYGLGGHLGPDLTNEYSRRSPEFIAAFVQNGSEVMPQFKLSEKEMNELIAFLQSTDASGNGDPRSFSSTIYGTIDQQ